MSVVAAKLAKISGIIFLLVGLFILARLYFNPLQQEINYYRQQQSHHPLPPLVPPNTSFALTIPKLGAAAPIIQDVDPYSSVVYQAALAKGIAHARGTALPGHDGNIFLFAHSSADLLLATQYNSLFYLIHHLTRGDQINVWYQDQLYVYEVTTTKIVPPTFVQYLSSNVDDETLTLMTCYPPGTTLRRFLVIAKPSIL